MNRMRRMFVPWLAASRGLLLGLACLAGSAVLAQEAPPPAATPPAPAEPGSPQIDVTGFVDFYYLYDLNKVAPALRSFDVQHNAFSLSMAEIAFAKGVTTDSRVGFRIDLDFGKAADLVAAYEPEPDGKEIYKHVQQAYLSVLAGSKLQLDTGKFVTPLGAEVIESQDNWNYSRSVLFGYAIPFYHTGLRATLPVNDKLTLAGYLVNGWNNSSEIRGDFPCVGLTATLKPTAKLTWIGTTWAGRRSRAETPATSSTPPSPSPPRRSSASKATSTTARKMRRPGGASRPTRNSRSGRPGRSSAATSTSTTRTAAS
jgi:hypothetical protein